MGTLRYEMEEFSFDDRVLAHVQIVISTKLRRGENFFLTCGDGTPDIFVHMETLRRFGVTELRPNQVVKVRFGNGPKGLMAAEILPESGHNVPQSH